ncbi:MAG TPA: beta-propeller fold lactonase family protein [Acidobacteriaceae bacterium]|nr:beta-propeller fold lactonase family protein [Acidobacteriaceae bacterium]
MKFRSFANSWVLAGLALALASPASLQARDWRLYVDNSEGENISIIDLNSMKVTGDINVGAPLIHGLALRPDGNLLLATVESDHTLRWIDTRTNRITGSVKLTGRPNECAVTPDGRYAAVPIRDGNSVNIVDVVQKKIVKVLPIKEPHNAVSTGSNRYLFVSSMGSDQINVIDLKTMSFSALIPAGGRPRPYVVAPDGKTMYIAVSYLHGFTVVNIPEKKVLERVKMPAVRTGPPPPRKFETPDTMTHGLAITPDGKELWVTSLLDNCIYIYDIASKKFVGHLATGDGPNWIVFSPDGKYGCVSSTDSDDVSIYDVREHRQVARIKVGRVPKRLAIGVVPGTENPRPAGL